MEELDLKELLMLFWNKKVKILLIVAIFMLIGVIYTIGFVTPVYTSSTTLLLGKSESTTGKTDTITTTDTAAKLANEIAKVFTQKVTDMYKINNVQVVDEAEISTSPSNINHTKDVVIFAFIGVVVAVMYVLIGNMLDTTIKSAEEVEKEFKVPVLASIPLYNFEPVKKGGKRK